MPAIICFSISAIVLLIAVYYLLLYIIFEHKEDMLGKTTGVRKSVKRKKNVVVWGKCIGGIGPWRVVCVVKDWRKGAYEYTVNNKVYKTHLFSYDDPSGVPHVVQIVYLRFFPKISYVKTDTNFPDFEIYSLIAFAYAVWFIIMGISWMF